jgi:hypothetical protein
MIYHSGGFPRPEDAASSSSRAMRLRTRRTCWADHDPRPEGHQRGPLPKPDRACLPGQPIGPRREAIAVNVNRGKAVHDSEGRSAKEEGENA